MKLTSQVERKQKAYNEAMRKRAQVNHSAGKAPRTYKEPQVRTLPIPSVARVSEPFDKGKPKWTNRIPTQLSVAVPIDCQLVANSGGYEIRTDSRGLKKYTRKVAKTPCKKPLNTSRKNLRKLKNAISN